MIREAARQTLPQAFSPSPKKHQREKPDYSADEFDSDSDDAKTKPMLEKFVVSLGHCDDEEDHEDMQDTSHFGGRGQSFNG